MLSTDISKIWQSSSDAVTLHALWGREEDTQPSTIRMDAALKMLLDRFKVDSAVVTLKDADGTFVKIVCGTDPLMMDCRNALKACAQGGNGVFVVEDIALRDAADHPTRQAMRFYAGAPIVAGTDGTPVGMLSLAKNPKKNKFPDFNSWLLKTLHGVAPNLLVNTASAGMRLLMKLKDAPSTEGNILKPSKDPHEIYGETLLPVPSKSAKLVLGVGLAFVALLVVSRVSGKD